MNCKLSARSSPPRRSRVRSGPRRLGCAEETDRVAAGVPSGSLSRTRAARAGCRRRVRPCGRARWRFWRPANSEAAGRGAGSGQQPPGGICNFRYVCRHGGLSGVYWIPVFEILERRKFQVLVVARDARHVPGRKTHVCDAQRLHEYGLLRASFRPQVEIAALRAYLRQRERLLDYAAAHVQHMQKALTQMNLRLHYAITDITSPLMRQWFCLSLSSAARRMRAAAAYWPRRRCRQGPPRRLRTDARPRTLS